MLVQQKNLKMLFILIWCSSYKCINPKKSREALVTDFKIAYYILNENINYYAPYAYLSHVEEEFKLEGLSKELTDEQELCKQFQIIEFAKFNYYITLMNEYAYYLIIFGITNLSDTQVNNDILDTYAFSSLNIFTGDAKRAIDIFHAYGITIHPLIRSLWQKMNCQFQELSSKIKSEIEEILKRNSPISSLNLNVLNAANIYNLRMYDVCIEYNNFVDQILLEYNLNENIRVKKFKEYAMHKYIDMILRYSTKRSNEEEGILNAGINFIKKLHDLMENIRESENKDYSNIYKNPECPKDFEFIFNLHKYLSDSCEFFNIDKESFDKKISILFT